MFRNYKLYSGFQSPGFQIPQQEWLAFRELKFAEDSLTWANQKV